MNKRDVALRVARYSELLDKVNWVARWRAMMTETPVRDVGSRYDLYAHVQSVFGSAPITYLEFGVHTGKSLKAWLATNTHPESRFVGFDTFTGLPEDWNESFQRGAFAMGGKPPPIDDPRVEFHVGLFQETLRPFLKDFRPKGRLVVHLDADLYSATLYVLTQLDAHLPAGTVLVFDEFQSYLHEFRAWHDYISAYGRTWSVIAWARKGVHAAIELTS